MKSAFAFYCLFLVASLSALVFAGQWVTNETGVIVFNQRVLPDETFTMVWRDHKWLRPRSRYSRMVHKGEFLDGMLNGLDHISIPVTPDDAPDG